MGEKESVKCRIDQYGKSHHREESIPDTESGGVIASTEEPE